MKLIPQVVASCWKRTTIEHAYPSQQNQYMMSLLMTHLDTTQLIQQIHKADEALDVDAFVNLLASDVELRLGSSPSVQGKEQVRQAIAYFFGTIKGIKHRLIQFWEQGDTIIFQAEVTYTRHDGSQVTLPYVDVLERSDGLVKNYKIYIDLAPLQQP